MKNSIKFIVMIVVMSAVILSCKKVDGPKPSTEAYLSSKTWNTTKATTGNSTSEPDYENCSGLVWQFGHDGKLYIGNGTGSSCNKPSYATTYVLEDMTIKWAGYKMVITSIDANNLVFEFNGTTYYCAPVDL